EDALDLVLQRDLVDLEERVGVRRLGRRARVAGPRRHLQRAELNGLADRDIERDDPAGDLVEAGEHRLIVRDLLSRRLDHDLVAGLQRGVLRRAARLALARRQAGKWRGFRRGSRARWRRQCLLLDAARRASGLLRRTRGRRQRLWPRKRLLRRPGRRRITGRRRICLLLRIAGWGWRW